MFGTINLSSTSHINTQQTCCTSVGSEGDLLISDDFCNIIISVRVDVRRYIKKEIDLKSWSEEKGLYLEQKTQSHGRGTFRASSGHSQGVPEKLPELHRSKLSPQEYPDVTCSFPILPQVHNGVFQKLHRYLISQQIECKRNYENQPSKRTGTSCFCLGNKAMLSYECTIS